MLEFEYSNDFDRFINISIYIYGLNLLNNCDYIKMNMKISVQDLKQNENEYFDIFPKSSASITLPLAMLFAVS
jgi:hypothetical protein